MALNQTINAAQTITLVTTAETAAVTSPAVSISTGNIAVIQAALDITTGTGVTALVVVTRRGAGTGGASIFTTQQTAAAATRYIIPVLARDISPGDQAGAVWTITVTQTGATGNGTVNAVNMAVTWTI